MPLLIEHHHEVMGGKYPLDPRWQDYAFLERLGRYVVFTAREDAVLVGYAAFHVDHHMHSAAFKHAVNDVLYIAPGKRDARLLAFLRYCIEQLKGDGAQHIEIECHGNGNLEAILRRRLGMRPGGRRMGMNL